MVFLKRHEDIGIGAEPIWPELLYERFRSAVRQAEIIENAVEFAVRDCPADSGIDQVAETRSFFDASAGFRSNVQLELAGVGGREEVLAQHRNQQESAQAETHKDRHEDLAAINQGDQDRLILEA